MRSGGWSPKKKLELAELLRAYWAKREARGQDVSIPPPLGTDPPAPSLSGPTQSLGGPTQSVTEHDTGADEAKPTPTIPPNDEDDDGVAFAEFRLRLLRKRR